MAPSNKSPDATTPSAAAVPIDEELSPADQSKVLKRVTLRLIPLLFCCYVIAYIDRINVGFAKLQLQEVLGVDPAIFGSVYGLGAGLFFIGYFLFEVPSNLILQRVGARVWIARIMIVWGLVSIAFMLMKGVTSFYLLRFLLGAAEAGFFPGVILYITYWYPPAKRARMIALFATGAIAPTSTAVSSSGKAKCNRFIINQTKTTQVQTKQVSHFAMCAHTATVREMSAEGRSGNERRSACRQRGACGELPSHC